MTTNLNYYKLQPDVKSPVYGTKNSACFDVHAYLKQGTTVKINTLYNKSISKYIDQSEELVLRYGDRVLIPTGLIFDIPDGYSVRFHLRSSMAWKQGVILANSEAVIDSDYYNETYIMLMSCCENPVVIKHGDRIAQGELVPVLLYDIVEINDIPSQKTDRVGGIGSTGV
jgi:dUTP pyrophosphatase